jgi:hypothetical protein
MYDHEQFLVDSLPERKEEALIEIDASEVSMEKIISLSKGFTWPLVIRGQSCLLSSTAFFSPTHSGCCSRRHAHEERGRRQVGQRLLVGRNLLGRRGQLSTDKYLCHFPMRTPSLSNRGAVSAGCVSAAFKRRRFSAVRCRRLSRTAPSARSSRGAERAGRSTSPARH